MNKNPKLLERGPTFGGFWTTSICHAETSCRDPNEPFPCYDTHRCELALGHSGPHKTSTHDMSWTDGSIWYSDEGPLEYHGYGPGNVAHGYRSDGVAGYWEWSPEPMKGEVVTDSKMDRVLWIIYWTCISVSVGLLIAYLMWLALAAG